MLTNQHDSHGSTQLVISKSVRLTGSRFAKDLSSDFLVFKCLF